MIKNYRLKISGKVQKVRYRLTALEVGEKLGVKGYIMNLDNGDVFAEIEAEEKILDEFILWCKKGPEKSIVEDIEITESDLKNFKKIQIIE